MGALAASRQRTRHRSSRSRGIPCSGHREYACAFPGARNRHGLSQLGHSPGKKRELPIGIRLMRYHLPAFPVIAFLALTGVSLLYAQAPPPAPARTSSEEDL